jgi:hypothetical protein
MNINKLYALAAIFTAGVLGVAAEAHAGSYGPIGAGLSKTEPMTVTVPGPKSAATMVLSAEDREIVGLARAGDAGGKPFMIVDKRLARVFIFDGAGEMLGATPALLGSAIGDDSTPGVGSLPLSRITPAERTTPAGRFAASFGENLAGQPVLWVDYDAAIALHSVAITNPKEHRLQRLATPSLRDKRASYGCINVSATFFDTLVTRGFSKGGGIVYVLPEVRPLASVFAGLPVPHRL